MGYAYEYKDIVGNIRRDIKEVKYLTPVNWTPDNRRSVNADQMCDSWVFFLYFYLRIVYILQVFRCLRRIRAVVTLAKKGGWHTFLPPYRLYAQVQVVFISTSAVLSLH